MHRYRYPSRLTLIGLLLWSGLALGSQPQEGARGDLRGAVVQGQDGTVLASYICGDFRVAGRFSLVGCGAASDMFLVRPLTAELSHYRLESAWNFADRGFKLNLLAGAGMAEGQLGQDAPGFFLNPESDFATIEAAGPELMVGVDLWIPTLLRVTNLRVRLDAGAAWLPGWKRVGGTSQDVVPFTVLTANAHF